MCLLAAIIARPGFGSEGALEPGACISGFGWRLFGRADRVSCMRARFWAKIFCIPEHV